MAEWCEMLLAESECSAGRQAVQDTAADAETTTMRGWLWDNQIDQQRSLRVSETVSFRSLTVGG